MIPTAIEEEVEHHGVATTAAHEKLEAPRVEIQRRQQKLIGAYKRRSLAARNWGDLGSSQRPLRNVTQSEASATFLRGLLETPTDHPHHKRGDALLSVALHIGIVATIIAVPLLFTRSIDLHRFAATYLTAPPIPAAPPPPRPAVAKAVRLEKTQPRLNVLTAPSVIPKRVAMVKEAAPPTIDTGGVVGGMPGGEADGILGGLFGGTGHAGGLAPPGPPQPPKQIYRVGGEVKPPRLITQVQPQYPLIAKRAHIDGIVVIEAVIDESGNVTQARVVSGSALLFQAALEAVSQWKYEPTYLNGIAVPLELQVEVTFHLVAGS